MAPATLHQRLEFLTLPGRRTKNFLARLADALGSLKLVRERIEEEWDNARELAIHSEEQEFSGDRWTVKITPVSRMQIDSKKLNDFLLSHRRSIEDFQAPVLSHRLTLSPKA